MLGMVCACRVIGWHTVARSVVLLVSISTGVLGSALLGAGAVMVTTTEVQPLFDELIVGVGVAVLLVSLLGVVGSLRESRCLLRLYALVLLLSLLALVSGCVLLGVLGPTALRDWLDRNWEVVVEQTPVSREEFDELVDKHILGLVTISSLVALVLTLDLGMACVLQASIGTRGRRFDDTEMESLVTE